MRKLIALLVAFALIAVTNTPAFAGEKTQNLESKATQTLTRLFGEVKGSEEIVSKSAGVLVFPKVTSVGVVVGGQGGEGVLRVDGKTVGYYKTRGLSVGLKAGAQQRSMVYVFTNQESLQKFKDSSGWEVGVDASVALVEIGADGTINTSKLTDKPVIGFVIGQKGLMADLSLEGSKVSKLDMG